MTSSISQGSETMTNELLSRTLYNLCPLCESDEIAEYNTWDCRSHPLWKQPLPWTIKWMICHHCGHSFTDGYFEGEALQVLLSNGQQAQQVQVNEQERWTASLLIDRVAAPQEVFTMPSPTWLDVGFGSGALVMTAQEFGYEATGLDLRAQNAEALQKLGYLGQPYTIEEYVDRAAGREFNVISMLDVLEHMPFPRSALDAAYKLLRFDGALVISCPNMDTAVWRELSLQNANPYWVEIEHYHNFSRKTLSQLLEAHGFIPVSYHVSPRYRSGMEIIAMKKDQTQ